MQVGAPQFRLGGIPIRVDLSFLLVAAFIGYDERLPIRLLFAWLAIVLGGVLLHELGHAVAYRAFGQQASILLHAFGGLTFGPAQLPKRWQRVTVSLAGPIAALVLLGLPALYLRQQAFADPVWSFDWRAITHYLVWVNVGWSIVNLLPILPLDGGHVAQEFVGVRRARVASIAVALGAAVWAYQAGLTFAALLAVLLAVSNFAGARRAAAVDAPIRQEARPRERGDAAPARAEVLGPVPVDQLEGVAWSLLRQRDLAGARRALARLGGEQSQPWLAAALAAAGGDTVGSLRLFEQAYAVSSNGPPNLLVAELVADNGLATRLAQRLLSLPNGQGVEASVTLQNHLHYAGRYGPAALVGERIAGDGRAKAAQVAFDIACSWSAAGEGERALSWLHRAVDAGFDAVSLIDGEPDLAAVRALPGFAPLRARLAR